MFHFFFERLFKTVNFFEIAGKIGCLNLCLCLYGFFFFDRQCKKPNSSTTGHTDSFIPGDICPYYVLHYSTEKIGISSTNVNQVSCLLAVHVYTMYCIEVCYYCQNIIHFPSCKCIIFLYNNNQIMTKGRSLH